MKNLTKMLALAGVILGAVELPESFAAHPPGRLAVEEARQVRSSQIDHIVSLQRRVRQLELSNQRTDERLSAIEDYLNRVSDPIPDEPVVNYCLLIDSGFSKTFLGKGLTKIDAEYEAKAACSRRVHRSNCNSGTLRCDTDRGRGTQYVCVITDSGFGKIFRGTGSSPIHAEAQARIECQGKVHASNCNQVKARCEASS